MAEYQWRRAIPLFFPDGKLDRGGVLRVPILARLGVTFLVTAVLPPAPDAASRTSASTRRFGGELPPDLQPLWDGLVRTQLYIVVVTGVGLARHGVARRAHDQPAGAGAPPGDGRRRDREARRARARPQHGRARRPERPLQPHGRRPQAAPSVARELFGRYVSPAVAEHALERGSRSAARWCARRPCSSTCAASRRSRERLPAARVVELLNEFYAVVERVCEAEGGVLTQFLGDGVVVVFGGPLAPVPRSRPPRRAGGHRAPARARGAERGRAGPRVAPGRHRHLHRRHDRGQRRRRRPRHLHDRRRRREPGRAPAGEDARAGGVDPHHGEHTDAAARTTAGSCWSREARWR